MPPDVSHSRRTQSLLLLSKLLDCRDNASPFTLIIDSLEQAAKPLISEYVRRAKQNPKLKCIFISFETLLQPKNVDAFVKAYTITPTDVHLELKALTVDQAMKYIIIIDTLHPLLNSPQVNISTYLSSLIGASSSLIAVYHSSQPLPLIQPYTPHPLTLLRFLATTILTTHSLSHILVQKATRDRSLAAPVFGLAEDDEGTVQGLGANDSRGLVVECETRRKSGRGVDLWFFLQNPSHSPKPLRETSVKRAHPLSSSIVLLDDHPLYRRSATEGTAVADKDESGIGDVSFNLGLTEKQRRDREEVMLPHFDAQREDGVGEGGRILYDMGVEDDFDEEEDEI